MCVFSQRSWISLTSLQDPLHLIDRALSHISNNSHVTNISESQRYCRLQQLTSAISFFLFISLYSTDDPTVGFMFLNYLLRQRDLITHVEQLLWDYGRQMALDMRFYDHIGHSGLHSSASSVSSISSFTTSTTGASDGYAPSSIASMKSSASTPSLRSREGVIVPTSRPETPVNSTPGGNVKVVVRVRKFLPRGKFMHFEFLR